MVFYKNSENGYINSVETSESDNEITEMEYNAILDIIRNKPQSEAGYDYRLKEDLTWELFELHISEESEFEY